MMTDVHNELAEQFRKEMGTTGIDWDKVKSEAGEHIDYIVEDERHITRAYLGSILFLAPSGKYWVWFARSNVTDEEMVKDQVWYTLLEEESLANGFWTESGEGDGCDLFAVREATAEEVRKWRKL